MIPDYSQRQEDTESQQDRHYESVWAARRARADATRKGTTMKSKNQTGAPIFIEYSRVTSDGRSTYLATFSNWSDAQTEMRRSARDHAKILELDPPEFAADGRSVTIWIDRRCGTYERYTLTQVGGLYRYPRW